MRFHIPIKLPSLANIRVHWRKMIRIKTKQKRATKYCLHGNIIPPMPLVITITRIGPRKLDDDNLASACKYVRDAIAATIGVDDGNPGYTWQYSQRKGEYGIEVEMFPRSY